MISSLPSAGRPNPTLPEGTDMLPKIEHIVIVMMENHSYDARFGMLPLDQQNFPRLVQVSAKILF